MLRKVHAVFAASLVLLAAGANAQEMQPPIIDMHMHVRPWMEPGPLAERMAKWNIVRAGGASVAAGAGGPSAPAPQRLRAFREGLGERFIMSSGWQVASAARQKGAGVLSDASDPTFINAINGMEADIRNRGALMLGEIHVNSSNFAPANVRRKLPADGPLMQALWALANKHQVPLMIHMEMESDSLRQLDNLLSKGESKTVLIVAHCGSMVPAGTVRPLMDKHPNLYCDLSSRGLSFIGDRASRVPALVIYDKRSLNSGWRDLIEAHPDRFLVGTDEAGNWREYDEVVSEIRTGLLANLRPETARKVAYDNAARLLRMK